MSILGRLCSLSRQDLTTVPVTRGILGLAGPMITSSIFHSFQSLVDMYFVGQLGAPAVAAVGMSGSVLMMLITVFMGIHTATVAMVSRAIGADDVPHANRVAGQVLVLTAGASVVIGVAGILLARVVLEKLGGQPEVVDLGAGYMHIIFGGIFFLSATFVLNGILHGSGDAMTPLYLGILTTVCNVILNPIMIFGYFGFPALGVKGSAWATVVARILSLSVGFMVLLRGRLRVQLHACNLVPRAALLWRAIRIGMPSSLHMCTRTFMNLVVMSIVAQFGTFVLAAYAVGLRVRMVALFPSFGFGGAAATMVGQNLGAGQPERSQRSAFTAVGLAFLVTSVAGGVSALLAEPLIRLFNDEPLVVASGAAFLRITAIGLCTAPVGIVLSRSLSGAGDTISPLLISLLTLWGFQIPAAIYLSGITTIWGLDVPGVSLFAHVASGNETGVWIAMVGASVLQAVLTVCWFATGRWKRKQA